MLRRLNQQQATPLPGTDGAEESPSFHRTVCGSRFSPTGKLKKVPVTGGAAVTVCDAPNGRGGAWSEDGTIILSPRSGASVTLQRVSAAGGQPEPLTSLAEGEVSQRWPQVLPGGKAVLFTSSASPVDFDDANVVVQPLPSGARKVVQHGGYYARYVPSGHLLFLQTGRSLRYPRSRPPGRDRSSAARARRGEVEPDVRRRGLRRLDDGHPGVPAATEHRRARTSSSPRPGIRAASSWRTRNRDPRRTATS